eukprot:m.62950 g.62950  ORF g.62950 m.62950 type:complete len:597 (+) comp11547_c0_seq2:225-2015(+)
MLVALFLLTVLQPTHSGQPVHTPFGIFDKDCIIVVPHGSMVEEGNGTQLLVSRTENNEGQQTKKQLVMEAPRKCANRLSLRRHHFVSKHRTIFDEENEADTCPTANQSDNGWVLNANYEHPNISSFSADYIIPKSPKDPHAFLYYFIGMTNYPAFYPNQTLGQRNIIQPVLSWGRGDDGNKNGTWSLSQWFCCLQGVVTHTPYVWNFKTGDVIHTFMSQDNQKNNTMVVGANWSPNINTKSSDPSVNGTSSLSLSVNRDYNHSEITWINLDVTLEVYGVRSCASYPEGGMVMNNLVVLDNSSVRRRISPDMWISSRPSDLCDGHLLFSNFNEKAIFVTRTDDKTPTLSHTILESFEGKGAYTSFGTLNFSGFDLSGWDIAGYANANWVSNGLNITSPHPPPEHYTPGAPEGTDTEITRRMPGQEQSTSSVMHISLRLVSDVPIVTRIMMTESASWWWPTRFIAFSASRKQLNVYVQYITNGSDVTGGEPKYESVSLWTLEMTPRTGFIDIDWFVTLTNESTTGVKQWLVSYKLGSVGTRENVNLASTNNTAIFDKFAKGVSQGCERTLSVLVPQNKSVVISSFSLTSNTDKHVQHD